MSIPEEHLFDALFGKPTPSEIFGNLRIYRSKLPKRYLQTIDEVSHDLEKWFGIQEFGSFNAVEATEELIIEMWKTGWNPRKNNIDLFTLNFGCVLTEAFRHQLNGQIVVRSWKNWIHLSVWWPDQRYELFPFHITYKRMRYRIGKSLTFVVKAARSTISAPNHGKQ